MVKVSKYIAKHFLNWLTAGLICLMYILPGDPAILNATQGRNICRFGVDVSLALVAPVKDDIDALLPFVAFLHTK